VPLHGWAAVNGAFDVATREVQAPLGEAETKLYGRILWNGNNGWADAAGKRDALHDLRELRAVGGLDKDRLLGYLVGRKGFEAVGRWECEREQRLMASVSICAARQLGALPAL
jgi:hypothetical protein